MTWMCTVSLAGMLGKRVVVSDDKVGRRRANHHQRRLTSLRFRLRMYEVRSLPHRLDEIELQTRKPGAFPRPASAGDPQERLAV